LCFAIFLPFPVSDKEIVHIDIKILNFHLFTRVGLSFSREIGIARRNKNANLGCEKTQNGSVLILDLKIFLERKYCLLKTAHLGIRQVVFFVRQLLVKSMSMLLSFK
jgi:hypothetical protein